jgi:hypothetical protein
MTPFLIHGTIAEELRATSGRAGAAVGASRASRRIAGRADPPWSAHFGPVAEMGWNETSSEILFCVT